MFALGDITKFKGEKETCKILKPVWDVITDYLVIFLALLAVLFTGMEVTSGSFECLAAVDCPGTSRLNTSIFLSHTMNRNACKAFYGSQRTNVVKQRVVITDLKSSLQYAKFVNTECSKSAVPDFLSYFSLVLFVQALILIILDNMWLKLPITASAIEHFVELVMKCYASPIPNFALTQALSDIPATKRHGVSYHAVPQQASDQPADVQQGGAEIQIETPDDFDNNESYEYDDILEDPATVSAIKTLYENVQTLKKDIKSSRKIWRLYLLQSALQAILAATFLGIDIHYMKDLQEEMRCNVAQYISVPHDYFICSHGLAPVFAWGLRVYLIILGICIVFFVGITAWTLTIVFKCRCKAEKKENKSRCENEEKCKSKCEYVFQETELAGAKLADICKEDGDLGFLLHLLHSYSHVYIGRLAHFLSKKSKKKIEAFYLNRYYPVSELRKQLDDNRKKITFSKLRAIPQTIFKVATEIVELELMECGTLENENFDDFWKLTSLQKLTIFKCGLECIPEGILKMEWLGELNLKGNHITSIDYDISNLRNLTHLDLSHNNLQTIKSDLQKLENILAIYISGNPKFDIESLKKVLACQRLRILDAPACLFEKVVELNPSEQDKFNKVVKASMKENFVIPYTPEDAPHIDISNNEKVYKMDSCPKGLVIIFNNFLYKMTPYANRHGSEKDVYKLQVLFQQIGFDVVCCTDYGSERAKQFLEECAKDEKYKDCDCIVVCVLSHGTEDGLIFVDGVNVPVTDFISCVQKSPLYAEKPKLFFIQACRGNRKAGEVYNEFPRPSSRISGDVQKSISDMDLMEADAAPLRSEADIMAGVDIHIPEADVLLSYSTISDYVSFRNTQHGSWYVQGESIFWRNYFLETLAKVFSEHAWEEDVLSLLTLVNYEIVRFTTTVGWRQVPAPQSTLRKKLYFLPGYPIRPQQDETYE